MNRDYLGHSVSVRHVRGAFSDWSREQYEADRTGRLRSSALKAMLAPQGPAAFWRASQPKPALSEEVEQKEEAKRRDLLIGTLLHEWILEDKKNWFVTETRVGTKKWLDECDENAGLKPIKPREMALLQTMREAILRNRAARELIEQVGLSEQTVLWDAVVGGEDAEEIVVPCKARLDRLSLKGVLVDLKTTREIDRRGFEEQMRSYGYHTSAAFYLAGMQAMPAFADARVQFQHLVVSKNGWAYLWPLQRQWVQIGMNQVDRSLRMIAGCRSMENRVSGRPDLAWPDLQELRQGEELPPPDWYLAQVHSENSSDQRAISDCGIRE